MEMECSDVVNEIFSYIRCYDLVPFLLTSKEFYNAASNSLVYKEFREYFVKYGKLNWELMLNDGYTKLFRNMYISGPENQKCFTSACQYGHLQIAQWLYSLGNINIHASKDEAFRWTCRKGYVQIARWLYSLGNIDINEIPEDSFWQACRKGYLQVAQWLYSFGNINIYEMKDSFLGACEGGHLEIAKWLYSLGGVDIHAHENYVFIFTTDIQVKEWLNSLK